MSKERYYRAIAEAEYIAEGHILDEAVKEFRVGKTTIRNDLEYLAHYGYGEENERNLELYKKAKKQLYQNVLDVLERNRRSR